MATAAVIPHCADCGSTDLDISKNNYKVRSAVCNNCGWCQWVDMETGQTRIPGRSEEIEAEMELDLDWCETVPRR